MSTGKKKKSPVWNFFIEFSNDESIAICQLCPPNSEEAKISRGKKSNKSGYSTRNLKLHLDNKHAKSPQYIEFVEKQQCGIKNKEIIVQEKELKNLDDPARQNVPKLEKGQLTIETTWQRKKKLDKSSERFKQITEAITIMIFLDLEPYICVEKTGFLHLLQVIEPRYEVPKRNYFANTQIPEIYKKTKYLLIDKLKFQVLKSAFTTDIWTNASNSCLSLTIHYLSEGFDKFNYLLEVAEFNCAHTGNNIESTNSKIIESFGLSTKNVYMMLHDSAKNMTKAYPSNENYSINCSNHLLQLCIKDAIKIEKNVESLIQKVRTIVSYFHHSTVGKRILKVNQIKLNLPTHKLKLYCQTRWNGIYFMLARMKEQKDAINITLPNTKCEIASLAVWDWSCINQLADTLEILNKYSLEWQSDDACISEIIPAIALIELKLSQRIENELEEVTRFKIEILKSIKLRFVNISTNDEYLIATFLDPRFKTTVYSKMKVEEIKQMLENIYRIMKERELYPKESKEFCEFEKKVIY